MSIVFCLNIVMDNQAFQDENAGEELARILKQLANNLRSRPEGVEVILPIGLFDYNGNMVGFAEIRRIV